MVFSLSSLKNYISQAKKYNITYEGNNFTPIGSTFLYDFGKGVNHQVTIVPYKYYSCTGITVFMGEKVVTFSLLENQHKVIIDIKNITNDLKIEIHTARKDVITSDSNRVGYAYVDFSKCG